MPKIPGIKHSPSDHCYVLIQDHGQEEGGWGPAALLLPGTVHPTVFVYTGTEAKTLAYLRDMAHRVAEDTGKPTRLVKYTQREDVIVIP